MNYSLLRKLLPSCISWILAERARFVWMFDFDFAVRKLWLMIFLSLASHTSSGQYECCSEKNLCHILYNPPPPLITQNKYSFHAEIYIVFGTVRCRKSLTCWKINHPRREVSIRPKNVLPETFSSSYQILFKTDQHTSGQCLVHNIFIFVLFFFFRPKSEELNRVIHTK